MLARELTKKHETIYRDLVEEVKAFKLNLKGELTVVISEKNTKDKLLDKKEIILKAKKFLKRYSLKDTVDLIYESEKINKKQIYQLCLKVKNEKNN